MRELEFWKISPSGNATILVPMEALSQKEQKQPQLRANLAKALMNPFHVGAEQVGFIDRAQQRLDMMGGEFCLNATRAFATLLGEEKSKNEKDFSQRERMWESELSVSGAAAPVAVRVRFGPLPEQENTTLPQAALPQAAAALTFAQLPAVERLETGISRVVLPGITHIIIDEREAVPAMPAQEVAWRAQARELGVKYGLGAAAVGCLWLQAHGADWELKPVVGVLATQSLFYESACGSGTLACAVYLRAQGQGQKMRILQPSQDFLSVEFEQISPELQKQPHSLWRAWVAGPVHVCAHGTAFLS